MESFIKRYNSDLANDFGNLLSRVTNLLTKFFDSKTPKFEDSSIEGNSIKNKGNELIKNVSTKIEQMKVNEAIELILQFIRSVNKYLEIMAPWKLVKSDKESAGKVLFSAAEALRVSSLLLSPVMPDKTSIILKTFCAEKTSVKWGELTPNKTIKKHEVLFPRIDINKIEKENISHKKNVQKDNIITFDQFKDIELKTAKIVEVEKVEGADKLLKIQVEINNKKKQIVSGIAEYYSKEELIDKTIIVVTNLKPAKIFGIESNGMLLAAKNGKDLTLITLNSEKVNTGMIVH